MRSGAKQEWVVSGFWYGSLTDNGAVPRQERTQINDLAADAVLCVNCLRLQGSRSRQHCQKV